MKLSDGFQTSALKKNSFLPLNIISAGTHTLPGSLYFYFLHGSSNSLTKIFYWNSYRYCDINLSDYNGFLSKSFIFLMFVSNDATCGEYLGLLCILSSTSTLHHPVSMSAPARQEIVKPKWLSQWPLTLSVSQSRNKEGKNWKQPSG